MREEVPQPPPTTTSSSSRRPLPRRTDGLKGAMTEGCTDDDIGIDIDVWVPNNELMSTRGNENCTETRLSSSSSSPTSAPLFCHHDPADHQDKDDDTTIIQHDKTKNNLARIIFRVADTNDGTATEGRRMTSHEKKQVKYQLKQARQAVRKEKRKRQHIQGIQEAKRQKAERKRLKRLAWQSKQQQPLNRQHQQQEEEEEQQEEQQQYLPQPNHQQQEPQQDNREKGMMHTPLFEKTAFATSCSTMVELQGGDDPSQKQEEVDQYNIQNEVDAPNTRQLLPTPAMLTPAATCLAREMGILLKPSPTTTCKQHGTIMDPVISSQWAKLLLHDAFTPADISRSREEMRPMAYRVVPEVWSRLCPDSLWTAMTSTTTNHDCYDDAAAAAAAASTVATISAAYSTYTDRHDEEGRTTVVNEKQHQIHEPGEVTIAKTGALVPSIAMPKTCFNPRHDYTFAQLRSSPYSSYDEDAYLILKHLHQYSNLHIACGALFGCDFLLYDGHRDERHSFAGLRIYCCDPRSRSHRGEEQGNGTTNCCDGIKNDQLPIPSAYDMAGFVRTMNSARKIALLATVVREGEERDGDDCGGDDDANSPPRMMTSKPSYRIALVDLALEKVLTAPTHVRKGNTNKRRSEDDAANGLAKQKSKPKSTIVPPDSPLLR